MRCPIFRGWLSSVAAIEKVDDHTIDVVTAQPNPILPNLWTGLYMMDKEWSGGKRRGQTFLRSG